MNNLMLSYKRELTKQKNEQTHKQTKTLYSNYAFYSQEDLDKFK